MNNITSKFQTSSVDGKLYNVKTGKLATLAQWEQWIVARIAERNDAETLRHRANRFDPRPGRGITWNRAEREAGGVTQSEFIPRVTDPATLNYDHNIDGVLYAVHMIEGPWVYLVDADRNMITVSKSSITTKSENKDALLVRDHANAVLHDERLAAVAKIDRLLRNRDALDALKARGPGGITGVVATPSRLGRVLPVAQGVSRKPVNEKDAARMAVNAERQAKAAARTAELKAFWASVAAS